MNDSLIPTWQCLNIHAGPQTAPNDLPTEDCDYVVSVVAYQKLGWDVELGGDTLSPSENEGLFFTRDQGHKYLEFQDPFNNVVANAFFFFVQP